MKRILYILSALSIFLLLLVSCTNNTEPESYLDKVNNFIDESESDYYQGIEDRENAFKNNQIPAPEGIRIFSPEDAEFGESTLKSFCITKSQYNSDDAVISFTLDYTNTSTSDTGFFMTRSYFKVYQDGIELLTLFDANSKDENTVVRPGTTLEVVTCYLLRNTESDIEICVYDRGHDEILAEYRFPIK